MKNQIELLLIMSKEPIEKVKLEEFFKITTSELDDLILEMNNQYKIENRGFEIIQYRGLVQIASTELYQETLDSFFSNNRKKILSDQALEVLAAIYYQGELTRAEINDLRGVNSDYAISTLIENNLIEVKGKKDVVGNPNIYGLTNSFYRIFQVENQ